MAQAQAALEAARSTRAVRVLAAAELDAAELALARALAAQDAGQPHAEIGHLAYLAERHAAIARMQARERLIARSLLASHALITRAPDRNDLPCARADPVRADLIGRGVDPRRILVRCGAPGAPEAGAGRVSGFPDRVTGIAIAAGRNLEGVAAFGW